MPFGDVFDYLFDFKTDEKKREIFFRFHSNGQASERHNKLQRRNFYALHTDLISMHRNRWIAPNL